MDKRDRKILELEKRIRKKSYFFRAKLKKCNKIFKKEREFNYRFTKTNFD